MIAGAIRAISLDINCSSRPACVHWNAPSLQWSNRPLRALMLRQFFLNFLNPVALPNKDFMNTWRTAPDNHHELSSISRAVCYVVVEHSDRGLFDKCLFVG